MKKIFLVCMVLSAVFAATDNYLAANLTNTISSLDVNRSDVFDRSAVPHIVRSSNKNVHLVYTDSEGPVLRIYYTRSLDNGRNWVRPQPLSLGLNGAQEPVILNDSTDKLTVIFNAQGSICATDSLDGGNTWSKPFKVSGKFTDGRMPAAAIVDSGDIHLVWENAGNILYRMYSRQTSTWSTIYDVSKSPKTSTYPVIANCKDQFLGIIWLEQGEVVYRQLDLNNGSWGVIEQVSLEANTKLKTISGSSEDPAMVIDGTETVQVVWTNKAQILHRTRTKGFWSPVISRLSNKYVKSISKPSIVSDAENMTYVSYLEDNLVVVNQFNGNSLRWEKSKRLASRKSSILFSSILGGNIGVNNNLFEYPAGYDQAWVERPVDHKTLLPYIVFNSRAEFPKTRSGSPKLLSIANSNGFPYLTWQGSDDQTAVQIVINNRSIPKDPVLYDSKRIDTPANSYSVINFPLRDTGLYFFVRLMDSQGHWSPWSDPLKYKPVDDGEGPELEVTGIDADSMYLYSPDPSVLYFGPGLESAKEFIIRGTVTGRNSMVKKVIYSPAFGDTPPPVYEFPNNMWAVRYSIKSADEPSTIIITAYDANGHSASKIVSIVKDTTPPVPPSWVKIYPDKNMVDQIENKNKVSNHRGVYVGWTDGKDSESGIRYHLMGINQKWWQNNVHKSGDVEQGGEGSNTFYVYAVDNVGNVSEAGTDVVFIDSLPPDKPLLAGAVTSGNYFYGIKTADTTAILVNGNKDEDMEMTSSDNWRYKHGMHDGQKELVQFQAVDKVGNKSQVLEVRLVVDKTPPRLYYAEHNAEDTVLRVKDKLVVTAKADPDNKAEFVIEGLTKAIPMYDDGTRGDIKADDGIYTGIYYIDTEMNLGKAEVKVAVADDAGNSIDKKTMKPLVIDSSKAIALDNFEDKGDRYPWKNHCTAENISSGDEEFSKLDVPAGHGCLHINYDFQGQQTWAGLSSHEFLPKNIFGSRAYLNFWLKGSGSRSARVYIYLQGKNQRDILLRRKDIGSNYSVSLANNSWHKVVLPISGDYLDDLTGFTKYFVYVLSDRDDEAGEFFIDDLSISYKIDAYDRESEKRVNKMFVAQPRAATSSAVIQTRFKGEYSELNKAAVPAAQSAGGFISAPYLNVELSPLLCLRGKEVSVKIATPKEMRPETAYVTWGQVNGELQKTKLSGSLNVWKGSYAIPENMTEGEHFGTVYIKTVDKRLYKKEFTFKVLDPATTDIFEKIQVVWYPHPVISGKEAKIKVKIPAGVKADNCVLFLGEDDKAVYSAPVSREGAAQSIESWSGTVAIPSLMQPGEYAATLFIKTKDSRFYKKRVIYSVIK